MNDHSTGEKKVSITFVLSLTCIALVLACLAVGVMYLDYHSGSTSSSFASNGMAVTATARGFNSGGTGIGARQREGEPEIVILKVEGTEFEVSETAVTLNGKQIAEIADGTKSLTIVSRRGSMRVEADGKTIARVN